MARLPKSYVTQHRHCTEHACNESIETLEEKDGVHFQSCPWGWRMDQCIKNDSEVMKQMKNSYILCELCMEHECFDFLVINRGLAAPPF